MLVYITGFISPRIRVKIKLGSIGILIVVYYNPHITGQFLHPLHTLNNHRARSSLLKWLPDGLAKCIHSPFWRLTSLRPRRCKVLRTCSTVKRLKKSGNVWKTRQLRTGAYLRCFLFVDSEMKFPGFFLEFMWMHKITIPSIGIGFWDVLWEASGI